MAKPKQTARLDDWFLVGGSLSGTVSGHPAQDDGEVVTTSTVLSPPDSIKEDGEIETRHTIYKLGKKLKEIK